MKIFIDKNGKLFDGATNDVSGMSECQLDNGKPFKAYKLDGTPDTSKIEEMNTQIQKSEQEITKKNSLSTMTVEVNGKVFYADFESRLDIEVAIQRALDGGETSTFWKLAEEFEGSRISSVTLDELKEASRKALETKGNIVGVI